MTKLRTPKRCDVIRGILLAGTGDHRGAATGARGVPTRFAREYPSRSSSPEQRWTTAAGRVTSMTAHTRRRTSGTRSCGQAAGDRARRPAGRNSTGPQSASPRRAFRRLRPERAPIFPPRAARFRSRAGGLRGREASARGLSYFFLTSTPALPEGTLLALTANWYVVDAVGGVKPTSVPGSYLTDRM